MHLQQVADCKTHLSHFHILVSAYATCKENVDDLAVAIRAGQQQARASREDVIVDQDGMDHIFVVHPSGRVSLYRQVGIYDVIESEAQPTSPPAASVESLPSPTSFNF